MAGNHELIEIAMPVDDKRIRLAADLAIFHIHLLGSGARIDYGLVPLAAASALKPSVHKQLPKALNENLAQPAPIRGGRSIAEAVGRTTD